MLEVGFTKKQYKTVQGITILTASTAYKNATIYHVE